MISAKSSRSGCTTLLYQWKIGEAVTTIPTTSFHVEAFDTETAGEIEIWDMVPRYAMACCDEMDEPVHLSGVSALVFVIDASAVEAEAQVAQAETLMDCLARPERMFGTWVHSSEAKRYVLLLFNRIDQCAGYSTGCYSSRHPAVQYLRQQAYLRDDLVFDVLPCVATGSGILNVGHAFDVLLEKLRGLSS